MTEAGIGISGQTSNVIDPVRLNAGNIPADEKKAERHLEFNIPLKEYSRYDTLNSENVAKKGSGFSEQHECIQRTGRTQPVSNRRTAPARPLNRRGDQRTSCHSAAASSKHLRVLLEAGVVEVHAEANRRFYGLRREPFQEMEDWLKSITEVWEERLDRLEQYLQVMKENQKQRPE